MPELGASMPIVDIVTELPAAAGPGSFIVTHPQGINRYAYIMLSATGWYRLDLYTMTLQHLPDPPADLTFGAGVCAVWDASGGGSGRIYVLGPSAAADDAWFAYYDLATQAWTACSVAGLNLQLAADWAIDGALAHPCTGIAAAASDDIIYLTGNNGTVIFEYHIAADTWTNPTTIAARAVAAGAGCTFDWLWAYSADLLYSLDGGGVATQRHYGIAGDAWAADTPVPVWTGDLPNTGTSACASCAGDKLYVRLNDTRWIYRYDPLRDELEPLCELYGEDGVASVGGKICAYSPMGAPGKDYLLALMHGDTRVQRVRLLII